LNQIKGILGKRLKQYKSLKIISWNL